jgi:Tfp pilus assembly protein PilZ
MDNSISNRKFSRVDFRIVATVKQGAKQFAGEVKNLSLQGMFLATDQTLQVGDTAVVSVALDDQPENEVLVDVKVTRATEGGIAFSFDKIDSDSYIHLKNLVALNSGDDRKIQEEIDSSLDG